LFVDHAAETTWLELARYHSLASASWRSYGLSGSRWAGCGASRKYDLNTGWCGDEVHDGLVWGSPCR